MKKYLAFLIFVTFFSSCRKRVSYSINFSKEELLELKKVITEVEILGKKIKTFQDDEILKAKFNTYNDSIELFYSAVNERDSSTSDEFPNKQEISKLDSISGLSTEETERYKILIRKLYNKKLSLQNYRTYLCHDKIKGIYLYEYISEGWMIDAPDIVGYLTLLPKEVIEEECFKKVFRVVASVDDLYIVRIISP